VTHKSGYTAIKLNFLKFVGVIPFTVDLQYGKVTRWHDMGYEK